MGVEKTPVDQEWTPGLHGDDHVGAGCPVLSSFVHV